MRAPRPQDRTDRTGRADRDAGQVMLLSIAYGVLALLLVTVVVSATGVHLERKRLLTLADQAALAGAQAVDADAYYGRRDDGLGLVRLTPRSVEDAVLQHLAASPGAARLEGLEVVEATTPDGRTAVVRLRALARPTLLSWATAAWSDGIELRATSRARAG